MRGLKNAYADKLTLTVIEGSFEEIAEKAKPYDIGNHGLVGLIGKTAIVREPGHAWGASTAEARGVLQKHIDALLNAVK